ICQRMAGMLHHPLSLRSRPGCGSMFSVLVPCAPLPVQGSVAVAPAIGDIGGLHVLCVDNDPAILDGMQALLQRWGLGVDLASGLEPALLAVRRRRPDLLLVDFHLAEALDGLAVIAILQGA